MKYTAAMILAGGLNSHANQLDKIEEPKPRFERESVESWDGQKWVTTTVIWDNEERRYL